MQNNHASAIKGVNIAVIVFAVIAILACFVIVFAVIAILACFVGFALAGIGGSAINQYGHHLFDEALTSHHELERELAASGITVTGDITGTDVVNSLNFALALGMFGIGWELISAVVTLVAGIMGVRGASRREKLGGVLVWSIVGAVVALGMFGIGWELISAVVTLVAGIMGVRGASRREKLGGVLVWSIVGAVVALLGGRIITCILLIISAVLAGMDKRAYAIPYGQPAAQPYGQPTTQPFPLLGGRIITCILLIISAVLAGMDKRAYAIPYGQPAAQPYGQPTTQPFPQTPQASPYVSTYGAAGQSPAQAGPAAADEDPANANRPNA